MLNVLILGANGFIGRHLTDALTKKENVLLTVFGKSLTLGSVDNVHKICGDFEDFNALNRALKNQDLVYHCISQTIPASSWNNPLLEIEKNLKPSLQLIELAAENSVKKICFASSGGTIYGFQQDLLTEETRTEPFSPYGIVKRSIESFLQYAKLKYQLNYDIYRISNVYGEGQNIGKGLGFINTSLEHIISNNPIIIYGDGNNIRDYIYVKDVAKLLTLSTSKSLEDSDTYNVSSNNPISLNDLIELIKNVLGINFEVKYNPNRLSDNRKVILDNSKIINHFEEMSLVSLEEGIKNTFIDLQKTLTFTPNKL